MIRLDYTFSGVKNTAYFLCASQFRNFCVDLEADELSEFTVTAIYDSEVPRFRNLFTDRMDVFIFENPKNSQSVAVHAFSLTEAQKVLDEGGLYSDYSWTGKTYGPEDDSWYFDCNSYL